MDEYLSEKEQVDRLRQWWRENGWFLIGGAALGLLVVYGWPQYERYQARRSEAAALLYQSLQAAAEDSDLESAASLLEQLRTEHPDHAYTHQGALLMARATLISDPERAERELRTTMTETDDPELALIARLRLARVLLYRERYQDALALLDIEAPGQLAALSSEIKGDIHVALGDTDAARTAYLAAKVAPGAEYVDGNYLDMKLADLPGGALTVPTAALPPEPASALDAAEAPADAPPGVAQ